MTADSAASFGKSHGDADIWLAAGVHIVCSFCGEGAVEAGIHTMAPPARAMP